MRLSVLSPPLSLLPPWGRQQKRIFSLPCPMSRTGSRSCCNMYCTSSWTVPEGEKRAKRREKKEKSGENREGRRTGSEREQSKGLLKWSLFLVLQTLLSPSPLTLCVSSPLPLLAVPCSPLLFRSWVSSAPLTILRNTAPTFCSFGSFGMFNNPCNNSEQNGKIFSIFEKIAEISCGFRMLLYSDVLSGLRNNCEQRGRNRRIREGKREEEILPSGDYCPTHLSSHCDTPFLSDFLFLLLLLLLLLLVNLPSSLSSHSLTLTYCY